jgi:hypothetical protein
MKRFEKGILKVKMGIDVFGSSCREFFSGHFKAENFFVFSKLEVNFKVIVFVWNYHQNDPHGRFFNERIMNHR